MEVLLDHGLLVGYLLIVFLLLIIHGFTNRNNPYTLYSLVGVMLIILWFPAVIFLSIVGLISLTIKFGAFLGKLVNK